LAHFGAYNARGRLLPGDGGALEAVASDVNAIPKVPGAVTAARDQQARLRQALRLGPGLCQI
jgi:hypothetical protein